MERFKLNIDVKDAADAAQALQIGLNTIAKFPQQEQGIGNAILVVRTGKKFAVIRNLISYTVREED